MSDTNSRYSQETWTGEGLMSWAVRKVILPVMRVKRVLADTKLYERQIMAERKRGDAPPPRNVRRSFDVAERMVSGSRVYSVAPKTGRATKTVIYIHGGAYVSPLASLQWNLVAGLALRTSARVLVPCYPLAPEQDWQAAFRMMEELYRQVLADTAAENITVCGDSAGGGFSLAMMQVLRDGGLALPGRLILFSPWLDLRDDNPAQAGLEGVDPILSRAGLQWAARRWAGQLPLNDPKISPALASLADLPPTLMFSGTADLLYADAVALANRARHENIRLHFVVGQNMTHAWSVLPVPEAARLWDMSAKFIG